MRIPTASKPALLLSLLGMLFAVAPAGATAAEPQFGVSNFQLYSCANSSSEEGMPCNDPYTQAGGTPYELTTTLEFNKLLWDVFQGKPDYHPVEDTKDGKVSFPQGVVFNPQAVTQCSLAVFKQTYGKGCPPSSQVGTVITNPFGNEEQAPLYDVTPLEGQPAEFAFHIDVTVLITGGVRTGEGYKLSALISDDPEYEITKFSVTVWGDPADPSHDAQRGQECHWPGREPPEPPSGCEGGGESSGAPATSFVTLPTQCSGQPLTGTLEADSWGHPGAWDANGNPLQGDENWKTAASFPAMGPVTGCDLLRFGSSVVAQPDTTLAGEPVGLGVELSVPQTSNPEVPATSAVRNVTVALPEGMVISPSAAQGLGVCHDDPGVNPRKTKDEFGSLSASPASCDPSSLVGRLHITTPDLALPLDGEVFLGAPLCGPCTPQDAQEGRMVRLYLQAIGEGSDGITVKLAGTGSIDQRTGRLTTTFTENPQLPFNHVKLELEGGPRATLANPRTCGRAVTEADLTPWSSPFVPASTPSSFFEVTGCPPAQFAPAFTAATTSNQAGGFSPFTLAFGRSDADGFLDGYQQRMPPGLLGMLSSVSLCPQEQAAKGACGPESLIGHVQVLTGPGANPFLVTGGQVFITGPYKGAPYGLSIVVPAKAGPYTLSGTTGEGTVVVRAAISVDPTTAALTVTADPLPTILDGIPLQLRVVNVVIDRAGFTFNPTDCNPLSIAATMSSTEGQIAQVSAPFQVTNCAGLVFKPSFKVSTSGHTSRANGASLDAKLSYPAGALHKYANIARVKVSLPKQLPSRLTTLQKACAAAQFESNPAGCPAASVVGIARASTPVLNGTLIGPVYFVSHGGEAFPSLIVVLQGQGVRVDLVGSTFISKAGITSSTFKTVPDVPVSTFELYLPEGAYSALAANGNLCKSTLKMPTEFVAQNGAVIHQSTPIAVTGCAPVPGRGKAKKAKAKKSSRARRARRARAAVRPHRNGRGN
ncbi:MAG: hypothetical protein ACHQC8_01785 [Solirubrobacterales bacterium]